jgi:hypothetical protein
MILMAVKAGIIPTHAVCLNLKDAHGFCLATPTMNHLPAEWFEVCNPAGWTAHRLLRDEVINTTVHVVKMMGLCLISRLVDQRTISYRVL